MRHRQPGRYVSHPDATPQNPLLPRLRAFFSSQNTDAYLVGGFVRDTLLGRATRDIDLIAAGDTLALARTLADTLDGHYVVLDAERQVGRVVLRDVDGEAHLDLARLRGGSLAADLALRDFTMNVIAVPLQDSAGDPSSWPVIDPHGGQADLRGRVVRVVSPTVFQDDPVRPLRAVRFAAQLDFRIETQTEHILRRDGRLVARAAPERCREEFLKALAQSRVNKTLRMLDTCGALTTLIPELEEGRGVEQPPEHYWDVFTHHLETAARTEELLSQQNRALLPHLAHVPWRPWLDAHFAEQVGDGHTRSTFLRLTALLHDVAKPRTRSITPDNRLRFLGHPEQGAEMAQSAMRRLRFSEHAVRYVATIVGEHLRPTQLAQKGATPTKRALYRFYRDLGDAAVDTVYHCLADFLAAKGPWLTAQEWQEHCALMGAIMPAGVQEPSAQALPKLVDGNDLQTVFGMRPGPAFSALLESVREAQAAGEVTTREQALQLLQDLIARQGRSAPKAS